MARCRNVFQTLSTRCLGLLQVQTMDLHELVDVQDSDPGFWSNTSVGFTHRTAIDFLVDDEDGRKIIEGHALKPDELFSKQVKTILLTDCFFKPEHPMAMGQLNMPHYLFFKGQMFTRLFLHEEDSISAVTLHSLLSLVHRHADAIIRHPQKHFKNSQQQFLAIATCFGFSDWATEFLDSIEESGGELQLFVLRAACAPFRIHFAYGDCSGFDQETHLPRRLQNPNFFSEEIETPQDFKRETLIREILSCCSQPSSQAEALSLQRSSPQYDAASDAILNAWRCFLVHNLQGIADGHFLHIPHIPDTMWAEKMQTLQSFLSAGISPHFRHQRYIICVGFRNGLGLPLRAVVSRRYPPRLSGVTCNIYLEVNDDLLLSSIVENMSKRGVQELPIARIDLQPSVRVVMFEKWTDFPLKRIFTRASNIGYSDSEELFKEIMFPVPRKDFSTYKRLVAQSEFVLDGTEDIVDGLKNAGCELSEVDTIYECVHEDILR